ncbi:MAG: Inositol 2-dehydrogenase [Verrucomicrobiota bacterium]|jgi:predicted dehydrogenase
MNPRPLSRRVFLRRAATAAATVSFLPSLRGADAPGRTVVLGVMGVNSRGLALARSLAAVPGVEVGYLCDVDTRAMAQAAKSLAAKQARAPQLVRDFRRILEARDVDGLVIAAPDHWHGPATILACAAGKHVYVEKPASHNPQEGEWMIAAARKHRRVVQVGTQRRSYPGIIEGIGKVREGVIGRVHFARAWYNNTRASIGRGQAAPVPEWLDWNLWQGPAPARPYRDNLVHYNWHWHWHWGTGELGNNGIHSLDLCRWGLGVTHPLHVTSGGGKYRHDDDQETPDTHTVTFDYGDKSIAWEGRSWHPRGLEGGAGFGAAFYGEGGTVILDSAGYRVLDLKGVETGQGTGTGGDRAHFEDFVDCIRTGRRPRADIEEGHQSTLLCHLGNIAWRTRRAIQLDPKTGRIAGDRDAQRLWGRDYQRGWQPKV